MDDFTPKSVSSPSIFNSSEEKDNVYRKLNSLSNKLSQKRPIEASQFCRLNGYSSTVCVEVGMPSDFAVWMQADSSR
jgi:hypothetical protein